MSFPPRARAKIGGRARPRIGEDGLEQPGDALAPGQRVLLLPDQVLPDLDQDIGQSARSGGGVDRVAGERAVVRFVVADVASVEIGLREQRFDQRFRESGRRDPTRARFSTDGRIRARHR